MNNEYDIYKGVYEGYARQSLTGSPSAELVGKPLIFVGHLEDAVLREILTEYDQLRRIPFSSGDVGAGFAHQPISEDDVAQLNRDHDYFEISGKFKFLIWRFVKELKFSEPKILLDILNIRAWATPPSAASEFGPTGWHTDRMPISMFKIMLYLTEIGGARGGLQIATDGEAGFEEARGKAGTFVLFNNSNIRHRGVAPLPGSPARKCVEITVTPLPHTVSNLPFPKVGGVNSRHPMLPFHNIVGVR